MLFKSVQYSDDKIVEVIQQGKSKEVDKVLEFLYKKYYPQVSAYVFKNKGNEIEAEDLFQDAVITFYNQVKEGKYQGKSAIGTYLFSIAKYLWIAELKKRRLPFVEMPENHNIIDEKTIETLLTERSHSQLFERLMEKLTEGCKTILLFFYFEELSVKEIQSKMTLGSSQAVRTKKFRCLQSLVSIFQDNKISRDHFTI